MNFIHPVSLHRCLWGTAHERELFATPSTRLPVQALAQSAFRHGQIPSACLSYLYDRSHTNDAHSMHYTAHVDHTTAARENLMPIGA